jgi:rubrerythrin
MTREEAIDVLKHNYPSACFTDLCEAVEIAIQSLSAQPERKKGKWIHGREISREMIGDCIIAIFYDGWTCSECGCLVEKEREPLYKYCPNCGADMRGEKNETYRC